MNKRELKSLEKDLLLMQRIRSQAAERLRKVLQELETSGTLCTTLTLMITDLRKKIDDPTIKAAFKGRPKRKK